VQCAAVQHHLLVSLGERVEPGQAGRGGRPLEVTTTTKEGAVEHAIALASFVESVRTLANAMVHAGASSGGVDG
jgi:hypothetical protein